VWSTAEDQVKVARFLVDGDAAVLSDTLRNEITLGQTPLYPDLEGGYGYGLVVSRGLALGADYYDVPVWQHGGNTLAQTSTFFVLPEQRFAISILSNGYGDNFIGTLVAALLEYVSSALPPPSAPPAPPLPTADDLVALEGTFDDPFNVGAIVVTAEPDGSGLAISMPTLDELSIPYEPHMAPLSTRLFLMNVQGTDLAVTFWDGPDGELYFATRPFVATRSADDGSGTIPRDLRGPPQPARLLERLASVTDRTALARIVGPSAYALP
jgi:hypothetical protein